MTAESQQVSYAGYSSSEQWAEERLQERRSGASQKAYNRPPNADARKRPSWWPVFWLSCLIAITLLMISRQVSTSPTIATSSLLQPIALTIPESISSALNISRDTSANSAIEQSPVPSQPNESGPILALRERFNNAIQSFGVLAGNRQASHGESFDSDGRAVVRDSFLNPTVSLDSAAVEEQRVMDFLPGGAGIYRMRVWPSQIAWTTLGDVPMHQQFRLETTMQVNPLVPEGYGGFLARYQDDENYYIFVIDGNGNYQAALRQNGEWTVPQSWRNSPAIHLAGDEQNSITLEDTSDLLRVYANGALLSELEPALPPGLTGFVTGARSTSTAEVDYFGLAFYELP